MSLWRNRLARSTVNRKVGGSSPLRDEDFFQLFSLAKKKQKNSKNAIEKKGKI